MVAAVAELVAEDEDLFEPVPDACAWCGGPRAAHTSWMEFGHHFQERQPQPRVDRIAQSEITTTWTCTQCGAEQEVGGVADREWMECVTCLKVSFVQS